MVVNVVSFAASFVVFNWVLEVGVIFGAGSNIVLLVIMPLLFAVTSSFVAAISKYLFSLFNGNLSTLFSVTCCKPGVVLVSIGNVDADVTNLVDVTFRVTTIDLSVSSALTESV